MSSLINYALLLNTLIQLKTDQSSTFQHAVKSWLTTVVNYHNKLKHILNTKYTVLYLFSELQQMMLQPRYKLWYKWSFTRLYR